MRAARTLFLVYVCHSWWGSCTSEAARRGGSRRRNQAVQAEAALASATPTSGPSDTASPRKLDIVMAHYYPNTLQSTLTNWTGLLETDKAKALHPRVFVYELNGEIDLSVYKPLLGQEGVAVHLDNVGREGAVFLQHIIEHYDDLADHTLFSQAMADAILNARFEHLFGPNTGVLSLALYAHQYCNVDDVWLPTGQLAQLYSLFTRQFCPPEGYSCMFEGGFVVSKKRIRAHPKSVYEHVLSLLAAPMTHWIHTVHSNPHYKHTSNPFFGHSMERAWSLAFDCHDLWRYEACQGCDKQGYKDCHPEACQCFDE